MCKKFGKLLAAAGLLWCLAGPAGAADPSVPSGALLVTQPAYSGMQFCVYQPAGVPKGWYATYDGYLVYKDSGGVWRYGSKNGSNFVATGHIVGAVVPSLVGLGPVKRPDLAESPASLPVQGPARYGEAYAAPWMRNPAFLAVGKWGKSVDRMGVLSKPAAPVAWSGDRPEAIYVWTGRRWYQITAREGGARPLDGLRSKLYELTVQVNESGGSWREEDTAALARYVAGWGYAWLGRITLVRPSWPY